MAAWMRSRASNAARAAASGLALPAGAAPAAISGG
jgi:hypothetical protein